MIASILEMTLAELHEEGARTGSIDLLSLTKPVREMDARDILELSAKLRAQSEAHKGRGPRPPPSMNATPTTSSPGEGKGKGRSDVVSTAPTSLNDMTLAEMHAFGARVGNPALVALTKPVSEMGPRDIIELSARLWADGAGLMAEARGLLGDRRVMIFLATSAAEDEQPF